MFTQNKNVEKFHLSITLATLLALTAVMAILLFVPQNALATPTKAEVDAAYSQMHAMQNKAYQAAELYNEKLDAHDSTVKKMGESKTEIDNCNSKIETKKSHLTTRVSSMYRNGNLSFLDVLLGCSSFTQFLNTWNTLTDLNQKDADLIIEIKDLKAEAKAAYERYKEQEKQAAVELQAAKSSKAELDSQASSLASEYNSLSAELQAAIDAKSKADQEAADAKKNHTATGGGNGGGNNGGDDDNDGDSGYSDGGGSSDGSLAGRALTKVGCDYSYGAAGPNKFDCSGLIYWASGGSLPRSSSALYSAAKSRLPVSQAQYGDILWTSGHVGISLGGNKYVHASTYGVGVIVSNNASSAFTYVLRF